MRRTLLPLIVMLALAGCAPAKGVAGAPDPEPLFASEEEALAAAVEVYSDYQWLGDTIAREGGVDPQRIGQVATGAYLTSEIEGFLRMAELGRVQLGYSTFRDPVLVDFVEGAESLTMTVCDDVSAVDILDVWGVSIVSSDRPNLGTMRVSIVLDTATGTLLISDRKLLVNEC